jgi:hypothetical protein
MVVQIIEKFEKRNILYLDSIKLNDIHKYVNSKNNAEINKIYTKIKKYCKSHITNNFEKLCEYNYCNDAVEGRLFCFDSIQTFPKHFRGVIMRDISTDLDMRNCHLVILRYLCRLHNIQCVNLEYYINNRQQILEDMDFDCIDDAKNLFLSSLNSDTLKRNIKHPFFKKFDKEMKVIQKQMYNQECYKHIIQSVPADKKYNWIGSGINRIMCYYENRILQVIISELKNRNIEIASLMFDGLMIYGDYYNDINLLNDLEIAIKNTFPKLDMKLHYKHHSDLIDIPFDFNENQIELINPNSFQTKCINFEKTHCKIINKSIFMKFENNSFTPMNRNAIKTSYEHIKCEVEVEKNGKITTKTTSFINKWLEYENIRRFDDVGVYPPSKNCPDNIFNMWIPFEMELIENYEHNQEAIDFFLNHIKILCNHEEAVYDYFICWIGQMIQFPHIKTTCPTLISQEGAGKGSLMRLFEKMLGKEKVYETATPSRDVWGNFNGRMTSSFLVNLNELSKCETREATNKIKALITDSQLTINIKNVSQYIIESFHRFIITTNNPEPIATSKDERRKFFINSSDELIGNGEYFAKLYAYLEDIDVIKSIFEFFKNYPDLEKFHNRKFPITEYQKELIMMSIDPIEHWFKDYVVDNINNGFFEAKSSDLFSLFQSYCSKKHPNYQTSHMAFCVRFNRFGFGGVNKIIKCGYSYFQINIDLCLKTFQIDKSELELLLKQEFNLDEELLY